MLSGVVLSPLMASSSSSSSTAATKKRRQDAVVQAGVASRAWEDACKENDKQVLGDCHRALQTSITVCGDVKKGASWAISTMENLKTGIELMKIAMTLL